MSKPMNPDFRTVADIQVPDLNQMTGWGVRGQDEMEAINYERASSDQIAAELPMLSGVAEKPDPDSPIVKRWNEFQQSKGRYPGSADWSLLDEFCFNQELVWLPQIIGSCVMSNTFRLYVIRAMYQIFILGHAQELLGKEEFGPNNLAPYGPYSYGWSRKKAGMRRGDGSYCGVMKWALAQGVIRCNTPKLLEITRAEGVANDQDYPEPQGRTGASFYREMGNWAYLDDLKPYAAWPVTVANDVKSAQQLWDLLDHGEGAYVCSMEAIHKVGDHPDGFPIHARNPRDRWAHNMAFHGKFIASDGERFFRQSNESWGKRHIYNRRFSEVERAFNSGRLTVASIGGIDLSESLPPSPV